MIYDYECGRCRQTFEVVKPAKELEHRTPCPICGQATTKLFTFQGQVNTSKFEPHFNWAFGEEVHSKRQLNYVKRKYEDQTGKTVYEVGNEVQKQKPKRKPYTIDA